MRGRKLAILIGVLILAAGSMWMLSSTKRHKEPKYRLEPLQRGNITATVTATGTLSALTTVAVGSQVSGIISKIYADYNSEVKEGQMLAELDPAAFQAQLDQRRADLEKAKVETRNARIAFERSKKLYQSELLSQAEYDAAVANLDSMQATVKQAQAAMRQAEENLSHTKIVSPIDGVVVQRQYDIGQTVAASFQAPTLFTIAQDLTHMQVATNIDEADIGRIHQGQKANFVVDAFPERTFEGVISQIRLATQTVQNVVTYPVLIDVANPDLSLKPGMTANVTIPVETETNVLRVPNAALRFKPDPKDVLQDSDTRDASKGSFVYVPAPEGKLKPVAVKTSLTDGAFTAISSSLLKEGDQVATGLMTARGMQNTGGLGQQDFRRSR
ncbi:MAG TPA: efflux RND transporter periplasmic adaptor subunit [Acidobacteriota bacterium]|nr:efflux RND transporter periplasmic adaptor subunit [Acidobacteriota bacterium]